MRIIILTTWTVIMKMMTPQMRTVTITVRILMMKATTTIRIMLRVTIGMLSLTRMKTTIIRSIMISTTSTLMKILGAEKTNTLNSHIASRPKSKPGHFCGREVLSPFHQS